MNRTSLSHFDSIGFRVERATGPFRWATSPPALPPIASTWSDSRLRARLGGTLPPSTAKLAVPPNATASLRLAPVPTSEQIPGAGSTRA